MLKYSIRGLTIAGIVFGWGEFSSGLLVKTALDPSVKAGTCRLPLITRGRDLKLVLLWYSPGHQDDSLFSFPVSPAFCHVGPSSSLAWSKEPPSELLSSLWFNTGPRSDSEGGVLSSQHWVPWEGVVLLPSRHWPTENDLCSWSMRLTSLEGPAWSGLTFQPLVLLTHIYSCPTEVVPGGPSISSQINIKQGFSIWFLRSNMVGPWTFV